MANFIKWYNGMLIAIKANMAVPRVVVQFAFSGLAAIFDIARRCSRIGKMPHVTQKNKPDRERYVLGSMRCNRMQIQKIMTLLAILKMMMTQCGVDAEKLNISLRFSVELLMKAGPARLAISYLRSQSR